MRSTSRRANWSTRATKARSGRRAQFHLQRHRAVCAQTKSEFFRIWAGGALLLRLVSVAASPPVPQFLLGSPGALAPSAAPAVRRGAPPRVASHDAPPPARWALTFDQRAGQYLELRANRPTRASSMASRSRSSASRSAFMARSSSSGICVSDSCPSSLSSI